MERIRAPFRLCWQMNAGAVEKLLRKIEDVKEALARRKDAVAKEAFEELRAAEGAFLEALAEKGMRFEKGKIIGANEEETGEKRVQYSLREQFTAELDTWLNEKNDTQRLIDGGYFEIGKTADALKSIGMRDAKIYWRKSKIQQIMEDHPVITPEVIKKVPSIVENPIIVMKSQTIDSSITMFGDIKAGNSYVMVAVELNPTPAGGLEAEFNLISSTYDRSNNNAKNLIQTSEVLYLCDKKRADTLLMSLGVQFPSDQQVYGSIGSITCKDGKVNISGKKIFEENSSKPVQKSRKTVTATPPEVDHLTPMQKQTVANYTRARVYTKAEALAVVEDMAHFLDESYSRRRKIP